jgi:hypothetical protein
MAVVAGGGSGMVAAIVRRQGVVAWLVLVAGRRVEGMVMASAAAATSTTSTTTTTTSTSISTSEQSSSLHFKSLIIFHFGRWLHARIPTPNQERP